MNDIMPNDGERFILDVPKEREEKESAEQAKARKDVSVLAELLMGIDERIKAAESIHSLNMNPETSEESLKTQVLAARWRVNDLSDLKNWIEAKITAAGVSDE